MTRPSFEIELAADARFAKDLAAGGVFVPAQGFKVLDEIDLVVRGNAGELCLHARVVYIDPENGCGLELVGFGPEMKDQLAQLASTPRKPKDSIEMIALDDLGDTATVIADDDDELLDDDEPHDLDVAQEGSEDAHDASGEGTLDLAGQRAKLNASERLRGLSLAEQMKVARGPIASERMALERMYGKNVWDALLHNPGLTTPEVARLSRLGTLPRVLLEVIVNNNTWLQVPEVRRALLANPRLGTDQITRVLRLLPKHELKLASTVPAYPQSVRSMAKKLIKDSE